MMLTEVTAVPSEALPVIQFRDHLRLGTGFTDSGLEDGLLESYLRAAMSAIEAWTGKALILREFVYETADWEAAGRQSLPVAPVRDVSEIRLLDSSGVETIADSARYRLARDTHFPVLEAAGGALPAIPGGGSARVTLNAGFGPDWANIPADLGHAVILLAAYYHEYRYEARMGAERIPYGVSRLIAAWRPIRLGGRGR